MLAYISFGNNKDFTGFILKIKGSCASIVFCWHIRSMPNWVLYI